MGLFDGVSQGLGAGGIVGALKPVAEKASAPADYKKWEDVPWWERGILNVGSGFESIEKSLFGIFGAEDYAGTSFTDEKDKIKNDFAQKGSSSGWDWGTFFDGDQVSKVMDGVFGDDKGLDEGLASSLKTGAGISGGGVSSMDNLPNRLGLGGQQGGTSLGKALAVEQDPALQDQNYNRNNFSF